ncbi:MAG: HAMP domain-containing histidine kinase [Actinobacteria bacterium]|nr:MAG: HAMP domain-containing histidine kinase [Actinomycetota bacterium]
MRTRLLVSTVGIALAAVLVLGVPLGVVQARRERSTATSRLEREADAVAAAVDDRLEAHKRLDPARLRALVRRGHSVTITVPGRTATVVGSPIDGSALRVPSGASQRARVIAAAPMSELSERQRHVWLVVSALSAAGILAAVLLALVQGRRLARPLERLARTSSRLGTGDFSARAAHSRVPEIDAVAQALDASAVRIARLIGREREFSANVSHQLRTPLTGLRLRLEELGTLHDRDEIAHEVERALDQTDRLERTIGELLAASRGADRDLRSLRLDELVAEHAAGWRPIFAGAGRRLVVGASSPVMALVSAGAVGQALDVLLENALRHGAGPVAVLLEGLDDEARISVLDQGPGIPEQARAAIFERGSSLAGGTGVGLSLARALVEADGGRLVLAERSPPRFEIRLRVPR